MYKYIPFRKMLHTEEIGTYVTYGIKVLDQAGCTDTYVSDISVDLNFVLRLCCLCTQHQLDPVHLTDISEDSI